MAKIFMTIHYHKTVNFAKQTPPPDKYPVPRGGTGHSVLIQSYSRFFIRLPRHEAHISSPPNNKFFSQKGQTSYEISSNGSFSPLISLRQMSHSSMSSVT